MAETNLALRLQVVDPSTDWESVMIGNSRFVDDVWDLKAFIPAKTMQDSHKYINFGYIQNPGMKYTVKQYAYYKLGKVKPQTVISRVNGNLPPFIEFCAANGISSFSKLTQEQFLSYNLWLKEEKKVAQGTGYLCAHVVEEIVKIGQIKGWDVPKKISFEVLPLISFGKRNDLNKPIRPSQFRPVFSIRFCTTHCMTKRMC